MEPKSFWETYGRLASISLIGPILFTIVSLLLVQTGHLPTWSFWGALLGVPIALLVIYFIALGLKEVKISINFHDKKSFLSKLNMVLAELEEDFYPISESDNFLIYRSSRPFGSYIAKIYVQIENDSATIVGPKKIMKKLEERLKS